MPVKSNRTDVSSLRPSPIGDRVEGGFVQDAVVAVDAVGGPTKGDAVGIRREGPFPSALGPVAGVFPGSFPTVGRLVHAAVDMSDSAAAPPGRTCC